MATKIASDFLESPPPLRRWVIGRSGECDYVISHAQVSPRHANLEERRPGEFYLIDQRSDSGTFLNDTTNRIQETRVVSDDFLYFSPAFSITLGEILRALSSGTMRGDGQAGQMIQIDRDVIAIGRDKKNDVVIDNLLVNLFHARIEQLPGNRLLIQDLGSTQGTLVNGELIRGRSRVITVQDKIEIAGQTLSLQISTGTGGTRVGVHRQGIFVACRGADFQIKQRNGKDRYLLRAVSFAVFPGELVGLMGPSGSGKTTLLHVLLGTYQATGGAVEYNGIKADVFKQRFGSLIGYVPQEDMLHPELTVRETLYYQAKLRLPKDVSRQEIYNRIDRICFQLGLFRSGGIDVRDVLVGSPESKGLSGGQRKRLSLAIELLTEPKLLYLDEPTSGLSSRDTRIVMELLRKLASERNITIIITIHQPSQKVYQLLDKVIYLKNGRLGFFGPAYPDSISYFVPEELPETSSPDAVMEKLDEVKDDAMVARFISSEAYAKNIKARWDRVPKPHPSNESRLKISKVGFIRQFNCLLLRYLRCRWNDKTSLLVLLAQAPLVAVLLCLVFWDQTPQDVATVLFLLGFVSLWFGVNNSSREIVGEIALLRREKRVGLNTVAYLLSKFVGQGAMTLLQVALLITLTLVFLRKVEVDIPSAILVSWLASLAGISVGLTISAFVRSQIAAVAAVPLVLIPVILLGGLIKPFNQIHNLILWLANLTPARWAFEMMTAFCHHVRIDFFHGAGWLGGLTYMLTLILLSILLTSFRLRSL